MTIENRDLPVGTKLVGTHKKTTYVCEVVEIPDGGTRFQLEDGRLFNSPSAAGKAVMNGISCNGWRFWSVAGEGGRVEPAPALERESRREPSTAKAKRQVKKLPNQRGVEAGQVRWFCPLCMKSFVVAEGEQPDRCPEGHPAESDATL